MHAFQRFQSKFSTYIPKIWETVSAGIHFHVSTANFQQIYPKSEGLFHHAFIFTFPQHIFNKYTKNLRDCVFMHSFPRFHSKYSTNIPKIWGTVSSCMHFHVSTANFQQIYPKSEGLCHHACIFRFQLQFFNKYTQNLRNCVIMHAFPHLQSKFSKNIPKILGTMSSCIHFHLFTANFQSIYPKSEELCHHKCISTFLQQIFNEYTQNLSNCVIMHVFPHLHSKS